MERETATAWDLATLATTVNLSPSRFRHLFKHETGSSPAQFLKDMRLRQAESLLRTTFLSVKQILKQVGLGSSAHFVRDFRKQYGTTPTAYRQVCWAQRKREESRENINVASLGKT